MAMEARTEKATLLNIDDGAIEQGFQAALLEIKKQMASIGEFEASSGRVTWKIELDISVGVSVKDLAMMIGGRVHLKTPKQQEVVRTLHLQDGEFVIWNEPEQQPLFRRPNVATLPVK